MQNKNLMPSLKCLNFFGALLLWVFATSSSLGFSMPGLQVSRVALMEDGASGNDIALRGDIYINGVKDGSARAGEPTLVEMRFFAKASDAEEFQVIRDFEAMHMKFMHFVLISEDLQSFAHVHPFWDKSSASFQIPLNLNNVHPDNQDATRAILKGGKFFLYAEVKSQSLGMKKFSWDLKVEGALAEEEILEDPRNQDGLVLKYFDELGQVASEGALFRVRFKRDRQIACGGALVQLNIEIDSLDENGVYSLEKDLKPWMMMGAHALVLGANYDKASMKNFAHIHGDYSPEGAQYKISFFDRGQWGNELVRFWLQTKIRGKVRTFPLTFFYDRLNPALIGCP